MSTGPSDLLRRVWLDGRIWLANNVIAYIPSHTLRLFFYRKVMLAKIGPGSLIFMRAWFDCPGGLIIGNNSVINQQCRLDSRGSLTIGNNVSISAEVCILSAQHDIQDSHFAGITSAVTVGDYVFVGTRAMILPGVTLGEGSVVAAGAVVTKNVQPYTVVAGIPAVPIGTRNQDLHYQAHYPRLFQ